MYALRQQGFLSGWLPGMTTISVAFI
ncbi:conserved protein of unknown function [Limnospira indica PCC 8005]|uniref:Uncharacterized protein n=1 Tax=Limnospira indica PCC 8005 TaxID=376219 RepID=A0A9P1KJK2_9CYAN|nr:conserved protein of unknown function [Limnospira indica PCC 8005]